MAWSARAIKTPGSAAWKGYTAIPTLAVVCHTPPAHDRGLPDGFQDVARHAPGVLFPVHILKNHGKFIAAQPRDGIRGAHAARQTIRHDFEQRVPRFMPQGIIDGLKMIQVNKENPDSPAMTLRVGQRLLEPVVKQGPIGQIRQRIVMSKVEDPRFRFFANRHVLMNHDKRRHPPRKRFKPLNRARIKRLLLRAIDRQHPRRATLRA